jgi:hypothetical protein
MKRLSARVLALLTIVSMVLSLLPATALAAPPEPAPVVENASDAYLTKLSPDLRQPALDAGAQRVHVMILAQAGTNFGSLLERPLVRRYDLGGLRLVSGWATPLALLKIASLPSVDTIFSIGGAVTPPPPGDNDRAPVAKLDRSAKGTLTQSPPASSARPTAWNGVDVIKSRQANANGFDGNGVIVSVNDTGVDFGHPDLQGTQARDPNPASPFYGWPLVADGNSILTYLETGSADYTYYADTSNTFSFPIGAPVGTFEIFNGVLNHTITFSNTSKSGVYRYGWHPDYSLGYEEAGVPVSPMVLLVDETTAGVYDTVYVDLGDGWELSYDFTLARPARKGSEEVWADLTGDGVADISGGMIYWIADGAYWMPGTDVLFDMTGYDPPAAGDLVAFFGDYNGLSHGTGVASAIVAQGVIKSQYGQGANVPDLPGVTDDGQVIGGVLHGAAPRAKIFGGLSGNYDNWFIAALGYDYTPLTDDDAQIITNSWGYLNILPGWDILSRLATYVVRYINPYTTIMGASGNGGFGYGVMDTNGASSSILTVGASTQYGTDDITGIISDTSQITYDDVIYFSNRGPNGLGQVKPQVLCIGNSATGAAPLNLALSPLTHFYDGQSAWEEFGGTSQATPMCAGVLATVQQAYMERTGSWPSYLQSARLLMNGADNIYYDVLSQGAGRANADRSTKIAAGQQGAYVNPSEWNAGAYRGTTYEAFAHIVHPGASTSRSFSVSNWSATKAVSMTVSGKYLVKVGEVITYYQSAPESWESPYTFKKPDYLKRIDGMIPAGTDLMELSVYTPYEEFSTGDPTNPATQKLRGDNAWYVRIYDWTDWDGDGNLWTDLNSNFAVDPGELDQPATDPLSGEVNPNTSLELNALNEGLNSANTLQVRVQKPLERMHDGLWLGLIHRVRTASVPQTSFAVKATFYQYVDWPWLTTSVSSLTVAPGASATFNATLAVPADAKIGLYQGQILLTDVSGETPMQTVVPVVANVAANSPSFTFSNLDGSDQIFDNGRVFGGADWRGNGWYPQGDWRIFFTDVPDSAVIAPNSKFLIEASWVYTPTDIDILAYGPGAHDPSLPIATSLVGPYNLVPTGSSPQTVHSTGTGNAYTFRTSTGGPKELITAPLEKGLNEIMLHNVLYDGPVTGEPFTLTVGTAAVNPASVAITTTEDSLSFPVSFIASLDLPSGLEGMGFGLSAPSVFDDQFVAQNADRFYTFTVNTAGLLTLRTAPTAGNYDIDLYLERLSGTTWQQIGQSAGVDAYESIQVKLPANGVYRAVVNGYTVPGPASKYKLTIDVIQGTDVYLTGLPSGAISAGTTVTFTVNLRNMSWVGKRFGLAYVGPAGSPAAFAIPIAVTHPVMKVRLPIILKDVPAM